MLTRLNHQGMVAEKVKPQSHAKTGDTVHIQREELNMEEVWGKKRNEKGESSEKLWACNGGADAGKQWLSQKFLQEIHFWGWLQQTSNDMCSQGQEKLHKHTQTWERRGIPLWEETRGLMGSCFSDVYVCACMFIRVELHVTGSQHEGETQAHCSSLMRRGTWSESDGVPRAHSPLQKEPPDTLCYLQVSWDQPMNHVTRWFPG